MNSESCSDHSDQSTSYTLAPPLMKNHMSATLIYCDILWPNLVHRTLLWPLRSIYFKLSSITTRQRSYLINALMYRNQTWYTDSRPCSDNSDPSTSNTVVPQLAINHISFSCCAMSAYGRLSDLRAWHPSLLLAAIFIMHPLSSAIVYGSPENCLVKSIYQEIWYTDWALSLG